MAYSRAANHEEFSPSFGPIDCDAFMDSRGQLSAWSRSTLGELSDQDLVTILIDLGDLPSN